MFPIQDDQPKYSASTVTTLLIIVNVLVFLFEISLDDYTHNFLLTKYGLVADHFRPSALVTSIFLHGGWAHIIGNMLFLWAFGRSLEDIMGHGKFLLFYLLCGLAGGITHLFFNIGSTIPAVGASGAIAGVMGAYLVKFPRARIDTIVFLILIARLQIPAVLLLGYWFLIQLVSGFGSISYSGSQSGTAWFAHIGGFVAGIILVNVLGTRSPQWQRRAVNW